ncbi:MAG: hypothetical protein P8P36_00525 [Akkermansiaceae bacterium]|nr:hypothetical protein [Akkermansiaceae bacterium]
MSNRPYRLFKLSACQDAQVADKLKTYPTLTPLRGYPSSLISHGVAISRKSTLAIFAAWRD